MTEQPAPPHSIPREEMAAASAALTRVIERIIDEPDEQLRRQFEVHLLRSLGDARLRLEAWLAVPEASEGLQT